MTLVRSVWAGIRSQAEKQRGSLGDTWYLDEVFTKIHGEHVYLWRAVDQDGDSLDILVQKRCNKKAAKRFLRKLLKGQGATPRSMITDKLRSYAAVHREMMPSVIHSTEQDENNRAELSHQPTRQRERLMRGFTSIGQAQLFLTVYAEVGNLFCIGRHLMKAHHYREFRSGSYSEWRQVSCAQ